VKEVGGGQPEIPPAAGDVDGNAADAEGDRATPLPARRLPRVPIRAPSNQRRYER
jgi:hypothetical protein